MKTINKITAVFAFFFATTFVTAQSNVVSEQEHFYLHTLKELPSLDFTNEAKHKTFTLEMKDVELLMEDKDFYLSVLKEMPSLDFFNEAKYVEIQSEMKEVATTTAHQKKKFYKNVVNEMPSLAFIEITD